MKWWKRLTFIFFMMSMLMISGTQAFAANTVPGNVKNLKATASETTIKLQWSKVSGATGYRIYLVNSGTNKLTKVTSTKKLTYTIKNLTPGVKYTYRVYAFIKSGNTTRLSASGTTVSATPKVTTPAVLSDFKISDYGNKSITLTWSKVSNATGYYLYQYNSSTGKYVKIQTLASSNTSCTVSGLKKNTTYQFKIQSYRKVSGVTATSKKSGAVKGTARTLKQIASTVHTRYFNTTVETTTTATVVSTGKKRVLTAGTTVVAYSSGGTYVKGMLTDGTVVKVKRADLTYTSLNVTIENIYSVTVKQAFVNSMGYSSETDYLIWISQYTLTVNIFKGSKGSWKLVRSCPCVIGKLSNMTPASKTKTYKLCWRDEAYGGPRLGFTGDSTWGNSFHLYVDSYTQGAYSNGCIRLGASDLNYLATYCALGTTVVSY